MDNNDFVVVAKHVCPICGIKHTHDTEILLHKQLKKIPEDQRVTGYGLCEEHQKLLDDGFIALIPVNNTSSETKNASLNFNDANRIGGFIHLKRTVFNDIFNTPVKDTEPFVFVDKEVCEMLIKENEKAEKAEKAEKGVT